MANSYAKKKTIYDYLTPTELRRFQDSTATVAFIKAKTQYPPKTAQAKLLKQSRRLHLQNLKAANKPQRK